MDLEATGVSGVIGSLKSCLVEGDPEQRKRERQIRRRALAVSIVLQVVVVAALVLFPLLGKSERITYEQRILPPYAPVRAVHGKAGNTQPPGGNKKICIVCFDPRNPPRPLKPGEPIDTTLHPQEGDSIPGAPSSPGVFGGLDPDSSSRVPPLPEKSRASSLRSV